jgi:hypothetical protein
VDVQGTTARSTGAWDGKRRPRRLDQCSCVAVRRPQPGIHHAPREQPDVRIGHRPDRRRHRTPPERQPAQPEAPRHEAHALRSREHRRPCEQRPVMSQHPERGALPPRRHPVRRRQRGLRLLHEVPERHSAGAHRLAAAALHTRLEVPHDRVVDGSAPPLHRPHRVDPTTRREALLPRHPERRTVWEAQPATHAGRQLLLVEGQHPTTLA